MRRVADTRTGRPGLLARRPWIDRSFHPALRALVDLYDRGLRSAEELSRQRAELFVP